MKGILNKLTPEKFDRLLGLLIEQVRAVQVCECAGWGFMRSAPCLAAGSSSLPGPAFAVCLCLPLSTILVLDTIFFPGLGGQDLTGDRAIWSRDRALWRLNHVQLAGTGITGGAVTSSGAGEGAWPAAAVEPCGRREAGQPLCAGR